MEWMLDNMWLVWLGLALAFAAIEAATVDFTFVMLAGGALVGAIAALLGAPLVVQIVVALIVAVLLLGIIRPIVKRTFLDSEASRGIGAEALMGRLGVVTESVSPSGGRVKVAGDIWSARTIEGGPTLAADDHVRVISIDGATLVVVLDL